VAVHPASVQDRDGAKPLIEATVAAFPSLAKVRADGGYAGALVEWARERGVDLEIVRKPKEGFEALPRRWVVERTFGWIVRNRRLRCDYEATVKSATAYVLLAMASVMLRRLGR
jgi:transposase